MLRRISKNEFQEYKEITKTDYLGNEYTFTKYGDTWTLETIQTEIDNLTDKINRLQDKKIEARDIKTQITTLLTK